MASENSQQRVSWDVAYGEAPRKGSRSMPQTLDFSIENPVEINLSFEQESNRLEFVQSLYIDNSSNAYPLTCTMRSTGQIIIIPAGWQAYMPVMASADNCKMSFATTGTTAMIPIQYLSFPVPLAVWPTGSGSAGTDWSINKPADLANLVTTVPVNAKRAAIEVQNQSAGTIQVKLDDGAGNNISYILLDAGSGTNAQGGSWLSTTFKGRARVYTGTSTDQFMAREY